MDNLLATGQISSSAYCHSLSFNYVLHSSALYKCNANLKDAAQILVPIDNRSASDQISSNALPVFEHCITLCAQVYKIDGGGQISFLLVAH